VERADPAVARRVRAEEEAAERERLERDRELEKEMRELPSAVVPAPASTRISGAKQPCWDINHVPAIRPGGSYAGVSLRN
jgi:hypothetical protein